MIFQKVADNIELKVEYSSDDDRYNVLARKFEQRVRERLSFASISRDLVDLSF